MSDIPAFARENGWAQALPRVANGAWRRLRDGLTARRLHAPGFRAGRAPRLLGLGHMRVGRDFHAGDFLWLEAVVEYRGVRHRPELIIGEGLRLSDNVHIACLRRITLGSGLLAGSGVLVTDHAHGCYRDAGDDVLPSDPAVPPGERPLHSAAEVIVGANVWLGDGVAVLPGARIGEGAVIGARSVVMGVIPPRTIAVGSPARPVRRWDEGTRRWVALGQEDAGAPPIS